VGVNACALAHRAEVHGPVTGPLLQLTRYLRLYRDDTRAYVEAVLSERALELDALTQALLAELAPGPLAAGELVQRLAVAGTCDPGQAWSRLGALLDLGLLVHGDDEDRARHAQALSQPAAFPVVDQVEVTNHCPMQCAMCSRGNGPHPRPLGFMDAGLFAELVAQIAPVQRATKPLTLHNSGEPLLHRGLEGLVRTAADAGLRPELSANPGLLPLARYLSLRDAGLARLVLSLDGLSADTLHAIRGPAARIDSALANLAAILEHRRRSAQREPTLVLQMLRLARNEAEHQTFMDRFSNLQLPGVIAYLKDLDAGTSPALAGAAGLAPRGFCRAPWRSVVVLWDGRIVPCCYDGDGKAVLGDLRRQSVSAIWAGSEASALRARLASGRPDSADPCATCVHRPDRFERPRLDRIPYEPLHW
jgi:radical SAM protein with 4Fe4S-binding SPASM domain